MVICAVLITIAQNVNTVKGVETSDKGINGVGIFLIVSTLSFVVFFALGPGIFFTLLEVLFNLFKKYLENYGGPKSNRFGCHMGSIKHCRT